MQNTPPKAQQPLQAGLFGSSSCSALVVEAAKRAPIVLG
jgi:hypothetical protein